MSINLPMALAFNFKDFTFRDVYIYIFAITFFVFFALYYNKKTKNEKIISAKRREDYIETHPEISPEYKEAILNASIISGMNEEVIIASIGLPKRKKVLSAEPARSEVWIYHSGIYAHVHMGILQKWKIHHRFISFG
jgi:hypothetical protein